MNKIRRAFLCVCVALAFAVGSLPIPGAVLSAAAQEATAENGVYQIASAEDLLRAAANPDKEYILTKDIDLSDKPDWTPIGTEKKPFSGVFNGAGYSIKLGIDQEKTESGTYWLDCSAAFRVRLQILR